MLHYPEFCGESRHLCKEELLKANVNPRELAPVAIVVAQISAKNQEFD